MCVCSPADGGKKSYLASIESLADALDDDSDYDDASRSSNCGLLPCSNQMRVNTNNIANTQDEDKHTNHHHRVLHSYGHLPNYWDPNLTHMERVIMEIVETERTYVQDLHEIIEVSIDEYYFILFNCFADKFSPLSL